MEKHQLYVLAGLSVFIIIMFLLAPALSGKPVAKSVVVLPSLACSSYNLEFNYTGPTSITAVKNETTFGKFYIYNKGNVTENISIDASPKPGEPIKIVNANPFEAQVGNTAYYTEFVAPAFLARLRLATYISRSACSASCRIRLIADNVAGVGEVSLATFAFARVVRIGAS